VPPDSILTVPFDGIVLEGAPGQPPSERVIHRGIYRARPAEILPTDWNPAL
jgi:ribulose-5-phosphate 4-epimerase/fuculose-1-phosphate aldolase